MTDFLTSLTARSFGREPAIRPRVTSLFEPVRNQNAAPREALSTDPETPILNEVEQESDRERQVSRPMSALREDVNARNVPRPANASPISAVVPPPQVDAAARITAVFVNPREEEKKNIPPTNKSPANRTPQPDENVKEPAPLLHPYLPENAPKRAVTSLPVAARTHDELSVQEHRGLVLPPKAATDLTAQMKSAASAMNAGLNVAPRNKTITDSMALAPEPSVHVTIGRIEVRATSETKQLSRSRSASPVMSLEEYLHRRTQRGGQ
jgi:hypothetical protein